MKQTGHEKPFRHYIREWMERKRVNQERLAARLEVRSGTISKLLTGRMRLSDYWLVRIAWALDVDVPDLFRHPDTASCGDLLDGLNDEQKATIISLIDMLKKAG